MSSPEQQEQQSKYFAKLVDAIHPVVIEMRAEGVEGVFVVDLNRDAWRPQFNIISTEAQMRAENQATLDRINEAVEARMDAEDREREQFDARAEAAGYSHFGLRVEEWTESAFEPDRLPNDLLNALIDDNHVAEDTFASKSEAFANGIRVGRYLEHESPEAS